MSNIIDVLFYNIRNKVVYELYVSKIIAPTNVSCGIETTLQEAARMFGRGYRQIIVLENGKVKGLLTVQGLSKALLAKESPGRLISPYLEEAIIINHKTRVAQLPGYPMDRVVVVDDNDNFIGAISPDKLIASLSEQRDSFSGKLNAILETSSNGVISVDSKGYINYINHRAAEVFSVKAEEALGCHVTDIYASRLQEVMRTGKSELGHKLVVGNKTFITNRTPVVQNGVVVGALGIFQDITELQNVMEELTNVCEYKEILEAIIENDYDCIVVVDVEGSIIMFNKAYEEFINVPKEKAIGRHVTEVIENTRMHIVAKTGIAELAELQKIGGHDMICNRIPIKKDGKIWGAYGKTMFKDVKDLNAVVEKIKKLQKELDYYKEIVQKIQSINGTFDDIIGSGIEMTEIKAMALKVAQSSSTVLIRGESGTGKEMFARAIHYSSPRKGNPFIKINCSAIPETLLESELFGYEEGAFTGAKKGGKPGKFELAHKGTLFLDEIGDMPLNMQVKLLRSLQEKEIERVGGTASIAIDVRVVTATNRDLEELVRQGKFRLDLYYRLNVVELKIPPLRHHKNDLEELIYYLLGKLSAKMGCPAPKIEKEALGSMLNYDWPGNVRELENVLERSLNFIEGSLLKFNNLPFHIRNYQAGKDMKELELRDQIEEAERISIINALKRCGGNKEKAAKLLGISRASIYQKIAKYGTN